MNAAAGMEKTSRWRDTAVKETLDNYRNILLFALSFK